MPDRPIILERSDHTDRALSVSCPRLRGTSHLIAALLSMPLGTAWVATAPAGHQRVGVAAFVCGIAAMFGCSALLHLRRWTPQVHERLFRLDHTGIFLAIGGTGIALALLALDGWPRRLLLTGAIVGAGIGIVVEWLPFAPPRGFSNTVYLSLGWLPAGLLPWMWSAAGPGTVLLLLLGGLFYTGGAIIVGTRRPDPLPRWFGYHELFHALVIAAVVAHTVMFSRLIG